MAPLIRRVQLIVNPGSRRGLRREGAARRALERAGVAVEVLVTGHAGHAGELLRDGSVDADAVFVLGGDGMVMEVAGALTGSGIPIGVLRGGTGNLVAGVLGVPRRVVRAVPRLLAGHVRHLDLGRFEDGRCFAYAAGLGIDVDMVRGTSPRWKHALGMLGYVATAARSALARREYQVTAEVDGVATTERVTLAMVANAGSLFGGRMHIGPGVVPDDGKLDLCLYSPSSLGDVMGLTWRVVRGDFSPHRAMRFIQGKRIRLSCEPETEVQADGDLVGRTPVTIEVVPGAGAFLVPDGRSATGAGSPSPA